MHIGIVLVCEANDADDAVQEIKTFNEYNAQWSDWNELGGRWSDVVPNSVLKYTDDPKLFMKTVKQFVGFTEGTKKKLLEQVGHITLEDLATKEEYRWATLSDKKTPLKELTESERHEMLDKALATFRAGKLVSLLDGKFGSETNFFDTVEYQTPTDALKKRIKENPDKQFLVVWDYHF